MKPLTTPIIACLLAIISQASHGFSPKETYAGYYIDRTIAGNNVLLLDEQATNNIENIAAKLTQAYGTKNRFTIRILNSPAINAFATPGGFIYLTTGLLDFVESKDELATIIGHEMSHALESHYMKALSARDRNAGTLDVIVGVAGIGVSAIGRPGPSAGPGPNASFGEALSAAGNEMVERVPYALTQAAIKTGLHLGSFGIHSAMVAGYSRQRELDADTMGVKLARSAGFNPRAMIAFLKRLEYVEAKRHSVKNDQQVSKFFNAEPGISKRIKQLEKLIGTP